MSDQPIIHSVTRHAGVAGHYGMTAVLEYPGESREAVTFTSSVYGAPIVMHTPSGLQTFVSRAVTDRIGSELTEAWVSRFFGQES